MWKYHLMKRADCLQSINQNLACRESKTKCRPIMLLDSIEQFFVGLLSRPFSNVFVMASVSQFWYISDADKFNAVCNQCVKTNLGSSAVQNKQADSKPMHCKTAYFDNYFEEKCCSMQTTESSLREFNGVFTRCFAVEGHISAGTTVPLLHVFRTWKYIGVMLCKDR